MKIVQRFQVLFTPDKRMNDFLRECDFFQAGEGIVAEMVFIVTWKEGETVDEARLTKTAENIKKALEDQGAEIFSVKPI